MMWSGLALERINFAKGIRLGAGWATKPNDFKFKQELRDEQSNAGIK